MLGSITPLGERGRGSRWATTVALFTVASAAAGAVLGGLMGAVGASAATVLAGPGRGGLVVLGALILIGTALDAGALGRTLPSLRRQVNEDWLRQYRRWVYAVGFGFQLGLGVVTIVSISAVYLVFAAALLSGSPLVGGFIGGAFGLLRAMPLLATAGVRHPRQLAKVDGVLRRWDRPVRKVAVESEAALAAVAVAAGLV